MLKAQETISTLKPLYLLQPNIPGKVIFIFITSSKKIFWIKENQSDWEKVKIDNIEVFRDGGSRTYYFSGKEYNELHIPSPLRKNESCYISGDSQSVKLEKILLSEEKLQEIGITNQVKLDLSNIPETIEQAEKALNKKLKSKRLPAKRLTSLFKEDPGLFFDTLSEDSEEVSKPGTSSDPRFSN